MFFPGVFLLIFWLAFWIDQSLHLNWAYHGIYPRTVSGLPGILFYPFIHGDLKHLFANSLPFFALSSLLFYFYRTLAFRVLLVVYLLSGIMVWVVGRSSYHIGVSGIIYGLAGFLFVSGLLRKHIGLMAISFLVAFQYGSMIWGVLPIEPQTSWESHFSGLFIGVVLAFLYKQNGPQGSHLFWEGTGEDIEEEQNLDATGELPWNDYEVEGAEKKDTSTPCEPMDNPQIPDDIR